MSLYSAIKFFRGRSVLLAVSAILAWAGLTADARAASTATCYSGSAAFPPYCAGGVTPCLSNPGGRCCLDSDNGASCSQAGFIYQKLPENRYCVNMSCSALRVNPFAGMCVFDGVTIVNGGNVTAYPVPVSPNCAAEPTETRTCTSGVLSPGSFPSASCTTGSTPTPAPTATPTPTPTSTPSPTPGGGQCSFNGTSINHGDSVTAYQFDEVTSPDTCESETRTCNDGTMSGSFNYETCDVLAAPTPTATPAPTATSTPAPTPASCMFNGIPVADGASVTAYLSDAVTEPDVCQSESRTCSSGSLSGSYAFPACTVAFSGDGDLLP